MLRLGCCFHPFYNIWIRACVSASAWILVGLEFQSPPALTKTSEIGTEAFSGARFAEELRRRSRT